MEGLIYPTILVSYSWYVIACLGARRVETQSWFAAATMVEAGPGGRDHRERRKEGREERVKMVDRNGAVGRARTYGLYTSSRNVGYRK